MNFNNLSISAKLWTALACVIALLCATLVGASLKGAELNERLDAQTASQLERLDAIGRWNVLIQNNVTRVTASLVSSDPVVETLYKDAIPATITEISALQKRIDGMELSADSKTLLQRIGEDRKTVIASLSKARGLKQAGDQAGAVQEISTVFVPVSAKYIKGLDDLANLQHTEGQGLHANFVAQRDAASWFAKGMVIGLVILLALGTRLLIGLIRKPLRDAIVLAETIASGDLTHKIDTDRGDEFGAMLKAIDHMQGQLVHLVSDVRQGTDGMAGVSEEIAVGNHDLSQRTEQSAASLEETASSMQELTSNVKQAADSARQANQLAASAAQVAQRGGQVVGEVVTTMEDINASSRKISDIISVIDGIAFQTNILALNAAVEAARAGEQGRGFAVVASEVRSLAGRSADAAKEIKMLINTSVEKVEGGTRLVAQAGQTMTEIVGSVQRVTDIMGGITAASAEQADGISQINSAISHLDQMTQQNAALVEQSAAAASSMKEQAQKLSEVVATFKLNPSDQPVRAASAVRRPAPKSTKLTAVAPRPSAPRPVAVAKPKGMPPPKLAHHSAKAAPAADKGDWETF